MPVNRYTSHSEEEIANIQRVDSSGAAQDVSEVQVATDSNGSYRTIWSGSEVAPDYQSYSLEVFDGKDRAVVASDPAGGSEDVLQINYVDLDDGYDTEDGESFRGLNGGDAHLFEDIVGYQPDVAHARFDLYFPTDWEWHTTGYGGTKLPGFAHQNGCGAAGKHCTGEGFTARSMAIRPDHTWHETGGDAVPYGQYVYDDTADTRHDPWQAGGPSLGEWFTVDQRLTLNTPGVADGRIQGWINGNPAFDLQDYLFFDEAYSDLGIRRWRSHFYFGGTWGSPAYQELYYRNLRLWATDVPDMS